MPGKENYQQANNTQTKYDEIETAILDIPQANLSPKQLQKLKNLPETEPPLFTNKQYEMIATSAPITSATQAFLKHPDWNEYGEGRFYFQKLFGKNRCIEFSVLNNQEHQPQYITDCAEKEILTRYGVMAARLHAVFATYAARQTEPWKEPFVLKGSDLIKVLKVYKAKKLTKSQKLKAIADLASVVGTMGAIIHWYEGELNLCLRERSLLWVVSVQEYYQLNLLKDDTKLYEIVIRVQPGLWTYNFLNAQGERSRTSLYQYGFISKQFFDLDPHRENLTTSLALYIIQNSRAHKSGVYTILSLLSSVLPESQLQQAVNDYRYGWRLKEKVDEALLALKEKIGINIDFDDSTYPLWLRPNWALPEGLIGLSTREKNQRFLGNKKLPNNYIKNYLFPAKLTLSIPKNNQKYCQEFINQKLHKPQKKSHSKTKNLPKSSSVSIPKKVKTPLQESTIFKVSELLKTSNLTGAIVRQARTAKHMSQRQVASAVGMSQSWVRNIEKDSSKPIPEKHAAKLREVLQLP